MELLFRVRSVQGLGWVRFHFLLLNLLTTIEIELVLHSWQMRISAAIDEFDSYETISQHSAAAVSFGL